MNFTSYFDLALNVLLGKKGKEKIFNSVEWLLREFAISQNSLFHYKMEEFS